MNKPSLGQYLSIDNSLNPNVFEVILYNAMYNVEYVDEDNVANYSQYSDERIRTDVYNACLKELEHQNENRLDDLDKKFFVIKSQIDVCYHDGLYLDKVTICKGYKNAVYCFADAATRIIQEVLDKYKKYCIDKMISVLGTMQLTQDILGNNEYMYDMLNNN